jgi:hypothetical protein
MKSLNLVASLQLPRANLAFDNLLDFAHAANTNLIEHLQIEEQNNEQVRLSFRLKHLFREFGMPQAYGELVFVRVPMQEEDGVGDEYRVLPPGEELLSAIRHMSISIPTSGPGATAIIRYGADIPDNTPNMVLHAAERVFRQAVARTEAMLASVMLDKGLQPNQEEAACPEGAALSDGPTQPWI